MESILSAPESLPEQICGCPVDSVLVPGKTYLAVGAGGRGVVLKKMDADCLLGALLHPSIRDRLSRVRELAHAGAANLHGVGRDGNDAYLIWEYLEGEPFDRYACAGIRSPHELAVAARELMLAVDSLHMQGIVHGALCGTNAIMGSGGSLRLTHLSPLLYTDPSVDVDAVLAMLESVVERRGEHESPLGNLLSEARRRPQSLRQIGAKVAAIIESRPFSDPLVYDTHEIDGPRRRNLAAAAIVALLGIAIGCGAWIAAESGSLALPKSFHLPEMRGK